MYKYYKHRILFVSAILSSRNNFHRNSRVVGWRSPA